MACLSFAAAAPTVGAETDHPERAQHVSILSIALDCSEMDGSSVTVIGAVSLDFEEQAICATREFLEADPVNCLWLATDDGWRAEDLKRAQEGISAGAYLLVEGVVSCDNRGFGDLYAGALTQIRLIVDNEKGELIWQANSSQTSEPQQD